ncbi:MAG: hypothetical protein AABZ15_10540 [Nitrospirota bacterium]
MTKLMEYASDWNDFLTRLRGDLVLRTPRGQARMIGLLFVRPDSELAKNGVLPHLGYYHVRSAEHITFYCVGYAQESSEGDEKIVVEFERNRWTFSNSKFNSMREMLEYRTKWRYSGMVDLIIANSTIPAQPGETLTASIDFSTAICINLDRLVETKAITGVEALFERIFRYAEQPDPLDPTSGLSDAAGIKIVRSAFRKMVFSLIPEHLRPEMEQAFQLAVRDIETTD